MRYQTAALIFWAFIIILNYPVPTAAYENQFIENKKNICKSHTTLAEKKFGIPKHLLTAISMAESGRWNKLQKENIAWPWTITSSGKGRFYNTKADALAEVKALLSQGIKNIDVGCMQVNLYYHGSKFKNYSEALDPEKNVAYAARYLNKLFFNGGDWINALGNYHSTTPQLNKAYRSRVIAYLPQSVQNLINRNTSVLTPPAPIDYQRMAKLNTIFHARIKSQSQNRTLSTTNARQLNAWRDARSRGEGMGLFLAKRRAAQRLKQKRQIEQISKGETPQTFAQRRSQQLDKWRLNETLNSKKNRRQKLGHKKQAK